MPTSIETVEQLEDLLSTPSPAAIDVMRRLDGDLVVLGVGGKMGPTLARMAERASQAAGNDRRIIGVSRFSTPGQAEDLQRHGVETISCDVLDARALAALPDVPNVLYLAGRKFGSTGHESLTWAANVHAPALVCERFAASRIVAFSTGNVYGLTPAEGGGSSEADVPRPVGEYAMSCLGRERLFEYFSTTRDIPIALLRLNYATELRYGVMVDLARRIVEGDPIDLTMGHVNVIWQADANAMALVALDHVRTPPLVVNIAGAEQLAVRDVAERLGQALGRAVQFTGTEGGDALLSNGTLGHTLLGRPQVSADQIIAWTAAWVRQGGQSLGKPTHFESRDGQF